MARRAASRLSGSESRAVSYAFWLTKGCSPICDLTSVSDSPRSWRARPSRTSATWRAIRQATEVGCIPPRERPRGILSASAVGCGSRLSVSLKTSSSLPPASSSRSEEHTSELQSHVNLVCRLLLEKKKKKIKKNHKKKKKKKTKKKK